MLLTQPGCQSFAVTHLFVVRLLSCAMTKLCFVVALLVALSPAQTRATDGPINSSLPFFTKYVSVVPTPYSTSKSDPKTRSTIVTFTTRRGTPVLRQQWFPETAEGTREIHNQIYNAAGRPRILEELHCTHHYGSIEIRSFRMDHTPIATRFGDFYGHASRITDSAGQEISEEQYSRLLREALASQ